MSEKIYLTIPVDDELFFKFLNVAKQNNHSKYGVLEWLMKWYIKKYSKPTTSTVGGSTKPDNDSTEPGNDSNKPGNGSEKIREDYKALTEALLQRFKSRAVGQLANIVLRELLERGVADDEEIEKFQEANGYTQVNRFGIKHGLHVNNEFGLSFPLLVTEERYWIDQNKFWNLPSYINGGNYYLCSQWVQNLHREKLENWIRKRLPAWLENADEDSRNEMIKWINSQ